MEILIGLGAVMVGLMIGMKIADIDFILPLTKHRSFLTHGFIFPLTLFALTTEFGQNLLEQTLSNEISSTFEKANVVGYFVSGFCLTYAIHLVFDMYPKKWHGIAKIHTPIGRMPGLLSWLWLGLGAIGSLYVIFVLLESDLEWMLAGTFMLFIFFEVSKKEKSTWLPLLTLIGVGFLSFLWWETMI